MEQLEEDQTSRLLRTLALTKFALNRGAVWRLGDSIHRGMVPRGEFISSAAPARPVSDFGPDPRATAAAHYDAFKRLTEIREGSSP